MAVRKLKLIEQYDETPFDRFVSNRFIQGLFTGFILGYLYFKIMH